MAPILVTGAAGRVGGVGAQSRVRSATILFNSAFFLPTEASAAVPHDQAPQCFATEF